MKKGLVVLGIVALCATLIGTASAQVQWLETFEVGGSFYDINYGIADPDLLDPLGPRQTGSMVTPETQIMWLEDFKTTGGDPYNNAWNAVTQITDWGGFGPVEYGPDALCIGVGDTWGDPTNTFAWASPDANFTTGDFDLQASWNFFLTSPADEPSGHFAYFTLGGDSVGLRPDTATSGISFVCDGNNGYPNKFDIDVYDSGTLVGTAQVGWMDDVPAYWNLEVTYEDGLMNAWIGTDVRNAFPDKIGRLLTDYAVTLDNNYITIGAVETRLGTSDYTWNIVDFVKIQAVPEPSSLVALFSATAMGGLALLRRRS